MNNKEQLTLLEDIKELLRGQAETQSQLLASQREYIELYRDQLDRVERINTKAEALQDKGAHLMGFAKKGVFVALVIVLALLVYLSLLLFL